MNLGQEVIDEALVRRGLIPCQLHRNILVHRLKAKTWDWVYGEVGTMAKEIETAN